jgi:hypothetical protein
VAPFHQASKSNLMTIEGLTFVCIPIKLALCRSGPVQWPNALSPLAMRRAMADAVQRSYEPPSRRVN